MLSGNLFSTNLATNQRQHFEVGNMDLLCLILLLVSPQVSSFLLCLLDQFIVQVFIVPSMICIEIRNVFTQQAIQLAY